MKKFALAAVLAATAASHAFAGSLAEPVVEPVVVEQKTAGSSAAWIIPVLLLALVGVAVAN